MFLAYLSSAEAEQAEQIMLEVEKLNDNVEVKRSDVLIDCKQFAPVIDRLAEMARSYLVEGFLSQDMRPDVHGELEKVGGYIKK
ncbi:MAG: hypothetical protein LUD84_08335 [Clostridiales bacterium]|nr:hypothetical protein [Clostridiales bacterium]